jgi:hypothetical protein
MIDRDEPILKAGWDVCRSRTHGTLLGRCWRVRFIWSPCRGPWGNAMEPLGRPPGKGKKGEGCLSRSRHDRPMPVLAALFLIHVLGFLLVTILLSISYFVHRRPPEELGLVYLGIQTRVNGMADTRMACTTYGIPPCTRRRTLQIACFVRRNTWIQVISTTLNQPSLLKEEEAWYRLTKGREEAPRDLIHAGRLNSTRYISVLSATIPSPMC